MFGDIAGAWISFDKSEIPGLEEKLAEIKLDQAQELTEEQEQAMEELYLNSRVVVAGNKLGTKDINGVQVTGYAFTIDGEELKRVLMESIRIIDGGDPKNDEEEEIDKIVETCQTFSGELWIDRSTSLLHQAVVNGQQIDEGEVVTELSLTTTLTKHNQAAGIQVPDNARSFLDVMMEMLSGLMGGIDEERKIDTPSIDSDEDGLSDKEEMFYGTDPNNPDTDGDGYLDGEEVEAGYNPNGAGTLPVVKP
jgi:hypothetical protein